MDQGGELYNNPKVQTIFEKRGFAFHPTKADASYQNSSVERDHCTISKEMQIILVGSSTLIKFCPYAFKHYLQMTNVLPLRAKNKSPVSMVTDE